MRQSRMRWTSSSYTEAGPQLAGALCHAGHVPPTSSPQRCIGNDSVRALGDDMTFVTSQAPTTDTSANNRRRYARDENPRTDSLIWELQKLFSKIPRLRHGVRRRIFTSNTQKCSFSFIKLRQITILFQVLWT